MADFDPFANQGGAAAWDPEHARDTRKQADELLRRLAAEDGEPGSGPSSFSGDDEIGDAYTEDDDSDDTSRDETTVDDVPDDDTDFDDPGPEDPGPDDAAPEY